MPASFAYCRECINANAHPYPMLVVNTALIGGLDGAADSDRRILEDDDGGRFWLFRDGSQNTAKWFLHGFCA